MEKTYKNINELKKWEKNPRTATAEAIDRLKKQMFRVKEITGEWLYKPLLITQDNIIIGGNMRYEALKSYGVNDVWVNQVNVKNEQEMVEIALSDNDNVGISDREAVLNFIELYPEIKLDEYAISFDEPILLKDFMDNVTNDLPHKCTCPTCGRKHNSKVNKVRADE
jgi:hypothetical protein